MVGVRIDIRGEEAVRAIIAEGIDRLDQPEPMFDEIGRMLRDSTESRFERETDPDGNPWPKSLRALLDGGKTLTDTARLASSITWEASNEGVAVGTDLIYAAIHQFGGVITPVNGDYLVFWSGGEQIFATRVEMPTRAFLGIDAEDREEIEAIVSDFVLAPFAQEAGNA